MRRASWLPVPIIALLPFVLLAWLVPAFSNLTIGNDYVVYSIENQLELQLALRHGTFPLFDPGFAAGSSVAALTLGQLYHPLSHLAALLPGYWDGRAGEWNTWLRLLSLGAAQLAVYGALVSLRLRPLVACIVSLATVYNLRMLDLFRYGASLEAYTAHLFLSASVLWYACRPTRRLGPAAIVVSTYLLTVSGHPQMAYYGLLAGGVVWLLAPFLVADMLPDSDVAQRRLHFYATTGLCMVAGFLLASAYTVPFVLDFMRENGSRFAQSYKWSSAHQDSLGGLLCNFVRPFHSDVHTAFGSSALSSLALAAPLLSGRRRIPVVLWIVSLLAVLVLIFALGSATPLHYFGWRVLPLQSTMRIPGRATMLLPMLLTLLLAWALRDESPQTRSWGKAVLALVVGILLAVGWLFSDHLPPSGPFSPAALHVVPSWVEIAWIACGELALVALAAAAMSPRFRIVCEAVCLIAVALQSASILAFGTWTTTRPPSPTLRELEAARHITLTYPFSFGWGMYPSSVEEHLKHTFFAPQLARLYTSTTVVNSQTEAYALLQTQRQPDLAIVETQEPGVALPNADIRAGEVTLDYTSFNRFIFSATSEVPALLVWSFPYNDRWRAWIDGQPAPLRRANGNELAAIVHAGTSRVELKYESPAAVAGIVVSLLTATILAGCLGWTIASRPLRVLALSAALVFPASVGAVLARRTYGGDNLGTRYRWQWQARAKGNIAFGKSTRMSSIANDENKHLMHSSRAVDGVVAGEGSATTADENDPWLQIDLGNTRRIGRIVVHEGVRNGASPLPPYLPLRVGVGNDPRETPVLFVIDQPSSRGVWELPLETPVDGRYVTLASTSKASMSLSEVEVYEAGPET